MNTNSNECTLLEPTEEEIRDYAYHLYEQSGCIPGRDLENWLEARDLLRAGLTSPSNLETHLAKRESSLVFQR